MNYLNKSIIFALIAGALLPGVGHGETISVGTLERAPFSFHNDNSELTGFSIALWDEIATRAELDYTWTEHKQFPEMINSVVSGNTHLAIANISITSSREAKGDFSQPIFESGMSIAVVQGENSSSLIKLIWESGVIWFLLGALGLVFLIANIIWFFERGIEDPRHDYFRDDYLGGVWDAFWWAFVIMSMGGFENEVPHRIVNRLLAMFWIIASLFFISTLTAKITTSLTVSELKTGIESYHDLKGKRVGVTKGSSHQKFLTNNNISTVPFNTLESLYSALKNHDLDAIVADYPVLSYYASRSGSEWMQLTGNIFSPENYGILLPDKSRYLEAINNALLTIREDGTYADIYKKYFSIK
ncbi:MAG: transporter substrate-binding domain-containing protein [Granulosicoccus sp.]